MIPLTAGDALLLLVRRVDAEERPSPDRDPPGCLYAVFAPDEGKHFLGLVTATQVAEGPQRIFADLVQERIPCVVAECAPLEAVLQCMDATDRWYFPVVDAGGRFIGAVTRARILEVLLDSYGRLLEQNRILTRRLFVLQEQERRSLSHELHDELGQYLTALRTDLGHLRWLAKEQREFERQIGVIEQVLTHLQGSVQRIVQRLRPALLDQLGLADTLRELVAEYRRRHPSMAFSLELENGLQGLPDDHAITLYRVVQESLTNVIRHAAACSVRICLCRRRHCPNPVCRACFAARAGEAERLHLLICDNGRGMSEQSAALGMGMIGMRERVEALKGAFRVRSQPGKGTWIIVELPLPEAE